MNCSPTNRQENQRKHVYALNILERMPSGKDGEKSQVLIAADLKNLCTFGLQMATLLRL